MISKEAKAAYDREYRKKNRELLRVKKAEYFQRTYNPVKAAVERKKRMPQHVEYCRQPEYRKYKEAGKEPMKITVQNADFINWEKVGDRLREEILTKAAKEIQKAAEAVKDLKPGDRKTFHIKVGSITISRPKE